MGGSSLDNGPAGMPGWVRVASSCSARCRTFLRREVMIRRWTQVAVHDDGRISGRGPPWKRGLASGVMTAIGGLGHALPYLIPEFWTATIIALIVVFVELWAIVWVQNRYMETPFFRATFQVVLGGALVLAAGILIGSA